MIRPLICADRSRVAALVIGAIDQDAVDACLPHFFEGYLLLAEGHVPMIPRIGHQGKPLTAWAGLSSGTQGGAVALSKKAPAWGKLGPSQGGTMPGGRRHDPDVGLQLAGSL
jgi:hypothetical protein